MPGSGALWQLPQRVVIVVAIAGAAFGGRSGSQPSAVGPVSSRTQAPLLLKFIFDNDYRTNRDPWQVELRLQAMAVASKSDDREGRLLSL
jgi:hypothetical protein